jgi:hypothetical protein
MHEDTRATGLLRIIRWSLLLLAGLSIVSIALELLFLRHWGGAQTIVWLGVAALSVALALLTIRPSPIRVRAAQAIALTSCLVAVVGLGFHVSENLDAGSLDRDYADRWEQMSDIDQLVAATTGKVGPAPTLAPGALAQIGLLLLIASLGHPALRTEMSADSPADTPSAATGP